MAASAIQHEIQGRLRLDKGVAVSKGVLMRQITS